MDKSMSPLNVIYSSDDNYVQHMGVSIISLLENNKEFKDINIFVIENGINSDNRKKLSEIVNKYKRNLYFIDFDKYKQRLNLNMETYISISSYARLFIQEMVPENVNKIIYIDCDTIINKSLNEFWNIDIKDYNVVGVKDFVGKIAKEKVRITNR